MAVPTTTPTRWLLRFFHCLFIFRKGEEAPDRDETERRGERREPSLGAETARGRRGIETGTQAGRQARAGAGGSPFFYLDISTCKGSKEVSRSLGAGGAQGLDGRTDGRTWTDGRTRMDGLTVGRTGHPREHFKFSAQTSRRVS